MKVQTHACDNCGIQKKDANRWWKVAFVTNGMLENPTRVGVLITVWDVEPLSEIKNPETFNAPVLNVADLCGEECAMKFISKNLFQREGGNPTVREGAAA